MKKVLPGAHLLVEQADKYLKGMRWAMLTNQSAVLSDYRYTFQALKHKHYSPEHIFAPEHGLFGVEQDQVTIESTTDSMVNNTRVISLYGQTREELYPKLSDLQNIDLMVIDIQDIGTRYYTFIYTMAFCMAKCAELNIPVLVCDRPNPINGITTEGAGIEPGYESFVGAYNLPVRHGLTIGEIAGYLNTLNDRQARLQVLPLHGWQRNLWLNDYFYPWVSPSPNMVSAETATVYAGTCLLEATNISEGRGTTRPFEIFGAPFIDGNALSEKLNAENLAGTFFRPVKFRPVFHKFANQICEGVFIHVTDRESFCPYATGIYILHTLATEYKNNFQWRTQPYEYVTDKPAIDILTGHDFVRKHIYNSTSLAEYNEHCKTQAKAAEPILHNFRIYPA